MQKRKILSDLYNGKLNPIAQEVVHGSDYQKAMEQANELEEKLKAMLNQEQTALLEEFISAHLQLSCVGSEERFTYGFRLGARMILEIFEKDDEQLKPLIG
ncbi:MAG: hypothetical protein LKJ17_03165 [Oscillospiraceae bacterium]|nr:hypothetical protein [Oscillospiraceae bacterium]